MRKFLAISGSPRKSGNTNLMLQAFASGVEEAGAEIEILATDQLNIKNCTGCLRCNILKRCSLRDDDWEKLSHKILASDVLIFASPIYFHHVTAPIKMIIDRFRSFVHVQITETGIQHTPHTQWNKDFVLILPMGSSDDSDAQPVIDLFKYMCEILGSGNKLHVLKGTRLAVNGHISKSREELEILYPKLNLPLKLASVDALRNAELLGECRATGRELAK